MTSHPEAIKIVLAEAAKTRRTATIKVLNTLGYTDIIEAQDGLEAKKLLQKTKGVSLIICDDTLPKMSGWELLNWMRTKSRNFKTFPFIMFSKKQGEAQKERAKKAEMAPLLGSPLVAKEVQKRIEQVLNSQEEEPVVASNNAEQGSLSRLLFDKGVSAQRNAEAEERFLLTEKTDKLEAENKALQDQIVALNETIEAHHAKSGLLFKQGVEFLKKDLLFEAGGQFVAVLLFEPDHLGALNNLAVIYHEMEWHDKARSTLKKILEIDPENEIARENLAGLNE